MASENPVILEIAADTWTKIASGVKSGFVHIKKGDVTYFQSHRITTVPEADPPPAGVLPDDDAFEGVAIYYRMEAIAGERVPVGGGAAIRSTVPRDIYIYAWKDIGRIRFDEGL
jgi:hypothetical protein